MLSLPKESPPAEAGTGFNQIPLNGTDIINSTLLSSQRTTTHHHSPAISGLAPGQPLKLTGRTLPCQVDGSTFSWLAWPDPRVHARTAAAKRCSMLA